MSYHRERRLAFRELARSIPTSKFPVTQVQVATLAWNLTEEAAARKNTRRLSLHKIFYVYVLMDPREPGPWTYVLPGGQSITFPYLPFYIGKGVRNRMHSHVKEAQKEFSTYGKAKLTTIREIQRRGLSVQTERISDFSMESVALAKEVLLIKTLGRADKRLGPLTNKSDGADGVSSDTMKERHARMSYVERCIRFLQVQDQMETRSTEDKHKYAVHAANAGADKRRLKSAEELEKTRSKRILSREKYRKNRSPILAQVESERRSTGAERMHLNRSPEVQAASMAKNKNTWKNLPVLQCPHCPAKGKQRKRMHRDHFENCRG